MNPEIDALGVARIELVQSLVLIDEVDDVLS